MRGLSLEIENALQTIIEGLNYNFFSPDGALESNEIENIKEYVQTLEPEKMKVIMESKVSSFNSAKKILDRWINSPNSPNDETIISYISQVIEAGDNAIDILRTALSTDIDYSNLDANKHNSAIKAKPFILETIFDLDSSLLELRNKLESGDLTLSERDFQLGYPERFAKGEFYPKSDYHQDVLKGDDVKICPFGTEGERIEIQDLGIILPKPPKDKSKILFYNEHKKLQRWIRPKLPKITTSNIEMYDDVIKEEYRRRREGVWFMNHGEMVYLTGNHYFALTHCKMLDNGEYMQFRYAQLKMFYHLEACILDKRCLGQLFGKSRRTGFTYAVLFILLNMATSKRNGKFGMMSKTGKDGSEAFSKISYAFLNLPFWARPIVQGKLDSPKEIYFGAPMDNSKEAKKARNMNIGDYLNTSLDWRNTKNGSYDSIKLDGYLLDEIFKIEKPNDAIVHLGMVTPTMMPAGKVVGKMFAGSTMGSHAKGGENGIELINGSMVKDRDPKTKKTSTGLYFYFLPAHENMEEFTDKYGKCHTVKPKTTTYNILGEEITMGSIEYLMAVEDQKKKQGDKAYNEQLRTYPRKLKHMMRDESNECVFNMNKIYQQSDYNDKIPEESRYTVGNFEWTEGKDSDVAFFPNPHGRFKVSWIPSKVDDTEHFRNAVKCVEDRYYPLNKDSIRFGCDPFSLKSTHGEGSKGGLHGLTMKLSDGNIPDNKFIVEYIARPSDETIFFEDVIKCVYFYGAPVLVESNRIDLLRYMRNRGYRGFAMDRLDKPKTKLNPNEIEYGGQPMSGKDIIDSHMNGIGAWIEKYVGISTNPEFRPEGEIGDMPFNETLEDWLKFNPDKRTHYDATISSGLAIMACRESKYKGEKKKKDASKVMKIFKKYNNDGNRISTLVS